MVGGARSKNDSKKNANRIDPIDDTRSTRPRLIYTRAQIAELYAAHRKGAYVGREAEWARQEADIIKAGSEGTRVMKA